MSIVVLDAFEKENNITTAVREKVKLQSEEAIYFKLIDMDIKRCKACGGCGDITPGKCVIKDEMQQIYRAVAKSETLIMLTPIRFGGYSSILKQAVDRFMPLGLPFYYVKKGTLFHKTRYGHKYYIGIGQVNENISGQEENFSKIVAQNAANLSYTGKSLVFKTTDELAKIQNEVEEVLHGGRRNEQ